MKAFVAFFLVIAVAFGGYHLSFRRIAGREGGFSWLHLTGLEFLVIGLLLGPRFLNILDGNTLRSLEPFAALALGWIGLLAGFQFEAALIQRFPPAFFMATLLESGITIVIVFFGLLFLLPFLIPLSGPMQVTAALFLSAAAACTAQSGLAMSGPAHESSAGATIRLLRYIGSLDGLLPMFLLVWIFLMHGQPAHANPLMGLGLLAAVLAALLVLYGLFLAHRRGTDELALITLGMTVLTSGAAVWIGFSPLPANFFLGICLVNLTREKEKIYQLLVSIEKPVYLVLLIFLGARWQVPGVWIGIPAAVYCMLRVGGKMAGGMVMIRLLPALRKYPRMLGIGLLEQGGLALAILLDFQQGFPGPQTSITVGAALLAVLLAQVAAPYFTHQLLKKARG